ncbi:hypothetical protein B0H11DRAFT_1900600 [Mycena galericulata]|nr:hypothetical protein B0H11DRAFT_1900600 [Mycena galericulata]
MRGPPLDPPISTPIPTNASSSSAPAAGSTVLRLSGDLVSVFSDARVKPATSIPWTRRQCTVPSRSSNFKSRSRERNVFFASILRAANYSDFRTSTARVDVLTSRGSPPSYASATWPNSIFCVPATHKLNACFINASATREAPIALFFDFLQVYRALRVKENICYAFFPGYHVPATRLFKGASFRSNDASYACMTIYWVGSHTFDWPQLMFVLYFPFNYSSLSTATASYSSFIHD